MSRTRALSLVLAAALLGACGPSTPSTGAGPTATGASSGPTSAATASGGPTGTAPAGTQPAVTEAPTSSDVPTDAPSPSVSTPPGAADACSGSDANRGFFIDAAGAVSWPVYCAVLPKGWFVSAGSYRLASGGKLVISYKGPAGATLTLSEGSFCGDGTGCVPSGTDAGDASLGSMAGTLVKLDGGGFAIVVNRGATPSWLLEAHGVDQAAVVALGAALVEVAG